MGFDHLILEDVNWKDELLVPPTAGDVKAPEDFGNEAWDYLQGINQRREQGFFFLQEMKRGTARRAGAKARQLGEKRNQTFNFRCRHGKT